MVRAFALITLSLLTGCTTTQDRLSRAETVRMVAQEKITVPDLPAACVAKMGRAIPTASEAWVVTQKRWEYLADNRDDASAACASAWAAYRATVINK